MANIDNRQVLSGKKSIADFCGVTVDRLDLWLTEVDFPATREGRNGGWITTKEALTDWLTNRVKQRRMPKIPRRANR